MIFDLDNFNESSLDINYDICISGAGAAGITLAIKLSEFGFKVILCEAGSEDYTDISQKNYIGKINGDPYFDLDVARLRYFGGSTNHWQGMCRPFEKVDFKRKYLGEQFIWPIKYEEILKYQNEACKILEITNNFITNNPNDELIRRINFQSSPPVRFKDKYINKIKRSKNLTLILNSNLKDIQGDTNLITSAVFENYNNKTISINAKKFIFSMGGIENSRYLLWFAKKYKSKYFDANCPIGKYWMEHPHFTLGSALVDKKISKNIYYSIDEKIQQKLKILNCGFRIQEISHKQTNEKIKEIMCIAPRLGIKIASLFEKRLVCGARLFAAWEQEPNISNEIKLTKNLSPLGIPIVELNWKKTPFDRNTIKQSINLLNEWLLEKDLGRIQLHDWLIKNKNYPEYDELAGYHHMGGTRMSNSKKYGVVDNNCKVFGSENLYIAGSSIFTTGGHNNPTLPIVQFSLRLADHLYKAKTKLN